MNTDQQVSDSAPKCAVVPPWGAVFLSCKIIGLGQFLVGRPLAGALWLGASVLGFFVTAWLAGSPEFLGLRAAGIAGALVLAIWVAAMVNAYRVTPKPTEPAADRPWIAALLSSIIPGIGQLYDRQWAVAICFLGLAVGSKWAPKYWNDALQAVVSVWATIDAFRSASRRLQVELSNVKLVVMGLVGNLALAILLAVTARSLIVQPFKIPTSAMAPTLCGVTQTPGGRATVGDHIFVDKLTYRFREPQRGEIVVFRTDGIPNPRGEYYVKRVVGLPGERVSIKPPHLYINSERVTGPPSITAIERKEDGYSGFVLVPGATYLASENDSILLGPDEYLVLGDNSRSSYDGRFWGPLPRKNIVGRVTKIYWPLNRMGITFSD